MEAVRSGDMEDNDVSDIDNVPAMSAYGSGGIPSGMENYEADSMKVPADEELAPVLGGDMRTISGIPAPNLASDRRGNSGVGVRSGGVAAPVVPEDEEGKEGEDEEDKVDTSVAQVKSHLPSAFELRMLVMGERFKREAREMEEWNRKNSSLSPRNDQLDRVFSHHSLGSGTTHLSTHGTFQAGQNLTHVNFGPNFTPRGEDDTISGTSGVTSPMMSPGSTLASGRSTRSASDRWARVRALVTRQKKNLDRNITNAERLAKMEEEEQKYLTEFWEKGELTLPPIPPAFDVEKEFLHVGSKSRLALSPEELENEKLKSYLPETEIEKFIPPLPPKYEESFAIGAENINLTVSKIPEELLLKQKEVLDNNLMLERQKILEHVRTKEVDILWREQLARERVIALEDKAHERIKIEKEKHGQYLLSKEQALAASFKRAREELEVGIGEQKAALYQKFGEYSHDEELMARKMAVNYSALPQPIEMRVHFLRAIKTKLPKGCYALMLSQYDRLGGRPLRFQNLTSYGIGPGRPAVSRVCKHHGRYFDRALKVEDSVFALCPPRAVLKPSFCLVLELFELQSHRNPTGDRVVAWAAMPMCNEHLAVVNGKFKLPFLRGEVTPEIEHFRVIEDSIAHDLNTWLCNGYVEIRHLSRDLLHLNDGKVKSKGDVETGHVGQDDLTLEFNYLSKQIKAHRRTKAQMNKREVLVNATGSPLKPAIDMDVVNASEANPNSPLKNSVVQVEEGTNVNDVVYPDDYSANPSVDGLFKRKNLVGGASGDKIGEKMVGDKTAVGKHGGDSKKNDGDTADDEDGQAAVGTVSAASSGVFGAARSSRAMASSKSGPVDDSDGSDDDLEIIERGYDSEDEFYMDEHQKGKLAGIETIQDPDSKMWAASGLRDASITTRQNGVPTTRARVVVRRLQSDGPRFDTEIVPLPGQSEAHGGMAVSRSKAALAATAEAGPHGWVPLTDSREIEVYSMAIASDPGARRKLLPSVISKSKLRYLYAETFGDLSFQLWGTFDFWVTVLVFVMSIWIRTYVHYIGQYFFLQIIPTPVYGFQFEPWQIQFKYMSGAIQPEWEVGAVAIGPATNLVLFLLLACSGMGFYKLAGYMPESGSKFIASYGVATILDPLLVLLVDLIFQNYNCAATYPDTCKVDYTSQDCTCFNGDFTKLWYRFEREEGSGVTGLIITLILYICTIVLSALLFYEYMLRVHRDAMILDLWRRIDAPAEEFFIPHDFEISHEELYSICAKAHLWRGLNGETRRLVISSYLERDPYDSMFQETTKHYAIYQYEVTTNPNDPEADKIVKKSLYRHFLLIPDGSIIEIFEEFSVDLNAHAKALANLLQAGGASVNVTTEEPDADALLNRNNSQSALGMSRSASKKAGSLVPPPKPKKFSVFKGLDSV